MSACYIIEKNLVQLVQKRLCETYVIAWRQQIGQANIDKLRYMLDLIQFVFHKEFHDILRPKFRVCYCTVQ